MSISIVAAHHPTTPHRPKSAPLSSVFADVAATAAAAAEDKASAFILILAAHKRHLAW